MASNADRIRPWRANPRYWQLKGEPVLLLGGTREDNLFQIPDLEEHLDLLVSVGGNVIRNTMSDRDEGNVYPYARRDDGLYDLDRWNEEYWERFEILLRLTEERDVIVQVEVWDRFDLTDAKGLGNWQRHPYNPANNGNYTADETGFAGEYPDHPGKDVHAFYHSVPGMEKYRPQLDIVRRYQERYVDRLLSHALPRGNVLYCMNNETTTEPAWGRHWMAFIKRRAQQAGVDVFVTDMFDDAWHPEDCPSLSQAIGSPESYGFIDISQVNSRNVGRAHWDRLMWVMEQMEEHPRPVNHTKIYSAGRTGFGSGTPQDGIERFWRNLLAGSASCRFHRPPSGIGLNETAQACIRAAREVEKRVKLWDVSPHMDLLSAEGDNTAYLAASPGEAYVALFCLGGPARVDLSRANGTLTLTWVSVTTGRANAPVAIQAGGATDLTAPTEAAWVAVITA